MREFFSVFFSVSPLFLSLCFKRLCGLLAPAAQSEVNLLPKRARVNVPVLFAI